MGTLGSCPRPGPVEYKNHACLYKKRGWAWTDGLPLQRIDTGGCCESARAHTCARGACTQRHKPAVQTPNPPACGVNAA
eukprot:scaffold26871_cov84-Isochrysis_galbana.AAC.1